MVVVWWVLIVVQIMGIVKSHKTINYYEKKFAKTECAGYDSVTGEFYIKE